MSTRHPIIVGVGQITNRSAEVEGALHPIEMAKMAVRDCVQDCECSDILSHVDSMVVVNIISWQYADPANMLCEMLDMKPRIREYTTIGGNTPQWLVNRAADKIASGEIEASVLVGAEAMYSVNKARKVGHTLSWPSSEGIFPNMIGDDRQGASGHEAIHGAMFPIQVYPLFENALRADRGLTIDQHRKMLSDFCAEFSMVASKNPLAWFRDARSSHEICEVTDVNRMIGFPYTKFMNAIIDVNQAAGLIITSDEVATKLSIPRDKWIYVHGGAEANDKWFVSERTCYSYSPAIKEVSEATLSMAGVSLDRISFFDLYSCFPCAPLIAAKSMGMDMNSLPPLTITGGLPYFGGAGNNYSMHAIAHAVERLRQSPEQFGYISALGWFITEHAAGVYSGVEPKSPWNRESSENIQHKIDVMESPELNERPEGPAAVETYTVMHGLQGVPEQAIVVARLEDGKRCLANTERDQDLFRCMETEEFIGKTGTISTGDNTPNTMQF